MRALLLALALGTLLQQPTFRSRVDVVQVDVTVVDADGRPVRDLRPDDFTITLDGTPRRVVSARFYGAGEAPNASPPAPSSFTTNTTSPPGRVVILVADLESIMPGSERVIVETASGLIDRLSPADAVGLLVLPGKGVELTRDREKVRQALRGLRGWASAPASRYTLSVREAEGFRNGDRRVMREVLERECMPPSDPTCTIELQNQVMPLLIEADRRTQALAGSLTALFGRLQKIDAPKAVVLLSAGMQVRSDGAGWRRDLKEASAHAGIAMSVVEVDQAELDASRRSAARIPRGDLQAGLAAVAGASDGVFYRAAARARGVFDRIGHEIGHVYQVGFEAQPGDADDRAHPVEVEVNRRGVTVRARKEVLLPLTPQAAANPIDVLAQPVDLLAAPVAVAAYMTRGEAPDTLKVILLTELLNHEAGGGDASYGIRITRDGHSVFETAERLPQGAARAAIAVQLAPGQYRLRAAMIDALGRPGSLELPLLVGLRPAGDLQFSDLILGIGATTFTPAVSLPADAPLHAIFEIYSAEPARLEGLRAELEVRRAGEPAVLSRLPVEILKTDVDRRRTVNARMTSALTGRGMFLVSCVVTRDGKQVGRVSRHISVQ